MNGPASPSHNRILNALTAAESERVQLFSACCCELELFCVTQAISPATSTFRRTRSSHSSYTYERWNGLGWHDWQQGESGVGLVMGAERLTGLAVVQIGGFAYRCHGTAT